GGLIGLLQRFAEPGVAAPGINLSWPADAQPSNPGCQSRWRAGHEPLVEAMEATTRAKVRPSFVHRRVLPNAFDVSNPADLQPNEVQFIRRVSELLPILTQEQVETLRERIRSGYYGNV